MVKTLLKVYQSDTTRWLVPKRTFPRTILLFSFKFVLLQERFRKETNVSGIYLLSQCWVFSISMNVVGDFISYNFSICSFNINLFVYITSWLSQNPSHTKDNSYQFFCFLNDAPLACLRHFRDPNSECNQVNGRKENLVLALSSWNHVVKLYPILRKGSVNVRVLYGTMRSN